MYVRGVSVRGVNVGGVSLGAACTAARRVADVGDADADAVDVDVDGDVDVLMLGVGFTTAGLAMGTSTFLLKRFIPVYEYMCDAYASMDMSYDATHITHVHVTCGICQACVMTMSYTCITHLYMMPTPSTHLVSMPLQ